MGTGIVGHMGGAKKRKKIKTKKKKKINTIVHEINV